MKKESPGGTKKETVKEIENEWDSTLNTYPTMGYRILMTHF